MTRGVDNRKLDCLRNGRLLIFGAGRGGRFIAEMMTFAGYSISYFIDSDSSKYGSCLGGIQIIGLMDVASIKEPYHILSSIALDEISSNFLKLGIGIEKIIDMTPYIRGRIPDVWIDLYVEKKYRSKDYRFITPDDLSKPSTGVNIAFYNKNILFIHGWMLSNEIVNRAIVSFNNGYWAELHRVPRADIALRHPYFCSEDCGFEGIFMTNGENFDEGMLQFFYDAELIHEIKIHGEQKSYAEMWMPVLMNEEMPRQAIAEFISQNIDSISGQGHYSILLKQILYLLDKVCSNDMQQYMDEVEKVNSEAMATWYAEQEIPMLFFWKPKIQPSQWHIWRRRMLLDFAEHYFPQTACSFVKQDKRIAIILSNLGSRNWASAILELAIANVLKSRGFAIKVVVSDPSYPNDADCTSLFVSLNPDSARYADDHRVLSPELDIHYCKVEGYIPRMREAYRVIESFAPGLVIDISGWGTVVSAALQANGYSVVHIALGGYSTSAVFDRYIAKSIKYCMMDNEIFHSIPRETMLEAPIKVPYDYSQYPRELDSDKRLPADGFILITVGNRLRYELDELFLRRMARLLDTYPRIYWVVVGTNLGEMFQENMQVYLNNGRVLAWGFEENLPALYRQCNVYVNPNRQGGGGSVTMAMELGLPVAMAKYPADILPAIGEENCSEDYDAMFSYIECLAESQVFYHAESEKMKRQVNREELSIEHYVDVILAAWEDIKKRGKWSWKNMDFMGD